LTNEHHIAATPAVVAFSVIGTNPWPALTRDRGRADAYAVSTRGVVEPLVTLRDAERYAMEAYAAGRADESEQRTKEQPT
jgi:hypothetical protein